MEKPERMIALIVFFICCFQGCRAQQHEHVNVMGPDVKAGLVVVFKKGIDWKEVLEFDRTVIAVPAKNGTGSYSLPGIMTVAKIDIGNFEGKAINFHPTATEAQKAEVKNRVSESPVVHRVYENVIPSEINDLDAEDVQQNTSSFSAPPTSKDKTQWVPAEVNGIVLGKSTYADILELWGKPDDEGDLSGNPVEPEEGVPVPELLKELVYRSIRIDDQRVNAGVLVGSETRIVKSISLFFDDELTKAAAIRKYGSDYYVITVQDSMCIERSQKRNKIVDALDYPIKLVYPQIGMNVQVRNDDTVMMVTYTDKCE